MFYFITCTPCKGTGKQLTNKNKLLDCPECNVKGYLEVDQSTYESFHNEQIEDESIDETAGEKQSSAFFYSLEQTEG